MLIDWFTVGAQALNFVILIWLLKRFLYRPILQAIDARETLIARELANAQAKQTEAQSRREEFERKNQEFDQQRTALLSQATEAAKAERQRLLEEARQAADALSAKRQEALRQDARNLNQAIRQRTQQEVFAIVRKTLTDLAGADLEQRMSEVFTGRLRALNGAGKDSLAKSVMTSADPVLVRSVFDLPATQQSAIRNALNETFSADIHVQFETAPDLVSGIELTASGRRVGWSIASYLTSLEQGVGELLSANDRPAVQPAAQPATAPP